MQQRRVGQGGGLDAQASVLAELCHWPKLASGPAGSLLVCVDGANQLVSRLGLSDGGFAAPVALGQNISWQSTSAGALPTGFAAAWLSSGPGGLRLARIDAAGVALDPGGVALGAGPPPIALAGVDDGGILAAWGNGSTLEGALLPWVGSIATSPLANFAGQDVEHCAAATPGGSRGLLACSRGPWGMAKKLFARALSGTAPPLEVQLPRAAANAQTRPAAAGGPAGFVAVWQDERNDAGAMVMAAPLDPRGRSLGVAHGLGNVSAARHSPAIAAAADGFWTVWKEVDPAGKQLVAQRLGGSGAPTGARSKLADDAEDRLAIAAGAQGVMTAWASWGFSELSLFGALLSAAGPGPTIDLTPNQGPLRHPSLAEGDGGFALAAVSPDRRTVEVRLLSADGQPLATAPLVIDAGTPWVPATALAFDGAQYLVAWEAKAPNPWSVFALRVSAAGAAIDPAPLLLFKVDETWFEEFVSDGQVSVSFDGIDFVVAFSRLSSSTGGDVVAVRVRRDGLVGQPQVVSGGEEDETEVSLAAGGPGRTLAVYRTFDSQLGAPRVEARVLAGVTEGLACFGPDECFSGQCGAGICCGSRVSCDPSQRDGGGGAGGGAGGGVGGGSELGPARYRVGCGCGAPAAPGGAGAALALLLLARRARRQRSR